MTDRAAAVEKRRSKNYGWLQVLALQWMRRDAAAEAARMKWQAANDPTYKIS